MQWLQQLKAELWPTAVAQAKAMGLNEQDAEDAVLETLEVVYEKYNSRPLGEIKKIAFRTLHYRLVNRVRGKTKVSVVSLEEQSLDLPTSPSEDPAELYREKSMEGQGLEDLLEEMCNPHLDWTGIIGQWVGYLAEAAQCLCKSAPAQADTLDALLQYLKLMDYLDQRAGPLYVKGGTQWMLKEEASRVLQVEMQTSQNTVRVRCDRVLPELYRIAQGLGNDVFHIREVALEKYPGLGQIEGEEKSP